MALPMAACVGAGDSPSSLAAASQDTTAASTPTTSNHRPEASGDPTTSPRASAVAVASSSPSPSSSAGSIDDPDLAFTLPEGWRELPIATYRLLVATAAEGASAPIRAASLIHLAAIDAGRVRFAALGPPGLPQQAASMTIQVESGDASLAAATSRITRLIQAIGPPDTEEKRPVRLPVGDAFRIVTTQGSGSSAPVDAVPSRAVQYVVWLTDGRTVWVDAVAPVGYAAFIAHLDASMATLRAR